MAICAAEQAILAANDAFLLPDSREAAEARAAAPATVGLAEFASFMVEWHALAARTGNGTYADVADHVVHMLQQRHPKKVPFQRQLVFFSLMHLVAVAHTE